MTGITLIELERARQLSEEGFDAYHDDTHNRSELIYAATAFSLATALLQQGLSPKSVRDHIQSMHWPAEWGDFKMEGPIRNLVKAGALIAAEIDRIQRLQK